MLEYGAVGKAFGERYGRAARIFRAPGRVNLIGEHTDYNGGFVLPMAIERETVVAAAPRADRTVRAYSASLDEELSFDLDHPGPPRRGIWLDYVEGVAQALESRGVRLTGADLLIDSDVPAGAGLSSSAALEISVGLALARVSEQEVDGVTLALAGQQAEHTYVGTLCGIMDQFVAALARERHALLIDCRSLEAEPVPLDTTEAAFVVADTRVKHELSSSEYNVRRAECARGVELLRERLPGITQLRDVSREDFRLYGDTLPEPIRRRCRHIVTENERTLDAARALRAGDLVEMGRLMYQSHDSLRDDYEVSSPELDVLVELARGLDGVLGSRMTGGGFGGSTVSLVRREALEEFERALSEGYERETGKRPAILVSEAGAGAAEVEGGV
ncbi:MAG: galactokinase [Acidobacteriota bacterium]|jgi:galactokinase|nr:galactokinase [Acidobacteriota bacterium]